jgi:uncharacterized membrane protein
MLHRMLTKVSKLSNQTIIINNIIVSVFLMILLFGSKLKLNDQRNSLTNNYYMLKIAVHVHVYKFSYSIQQIIY